MVMSFKSTLREPSKRMELVMLRSMLAAMPFMASKGLEPAPTHAQVMQGRGCCPVWQD